MRRGAFDIEATRRRGPAKVRGPFAPEVLGVLTRVHDRREEAIEILGELLRA